MTQNKRKNRKNKNKTKRISGNRIKQDYEELDAVYSTVSQTKAVQQGSTAQ